MKTDAIAFGIAGICFGLIAGWVIGSQQAANRPAPAAAAQPAPASGSAPPRAAVLDENQATALKSVAEREPSNAKARTDLGNLYFDAERYDEAIKWYGESLKLAPNDPNVRTDLGIAYYYTNQADKALEQFEQSLKVDPKHTKTLLNVGIVRAFGKQDLDGATTAWRELISIAPDSPEGQAAKRALDTMQSAHPNLSQKPGT